MRFVRCTFRESLCQMLLFVIAFIFFSQCKKEPDIEVQYLQPNILYDNEGNIYRTVVIGEQEWMSQNLNTANHAYGSSWCANDDPVNCSKYGRLYTWDAIMNGEPQSTTAISTVRGICPAGWHIPNDYEWRQLEIFIGMPQAEAELDGWRGTDEGKKLKSKTGWATHYLYGDGNGTDTYGFTGLPGGRYLGFELEKTGRWWSISRVEMPSINTYYIRELSYDKTQIRRVLETSDKASSLRCVKNKP